MNILISHIIFILGLAFVFAGCLGLLRFGSVFIRLQTATRCVTLGACTILFAVFVAHGFHAAGIKALAGIAFLAVTAPTAAHALAHAVQKTERKEEE